MRVQRRVSEIMMRMHRAPQPIISLTNGAASGGSSLAAELLLTGNLIDALRALALGLVSRLVDREELHTAGAERV
jgi:enoyl-CoA hydratase/carnithine racemase